MGDGTEMIGGQVGPRGRWERKKTGQVGGRTVRKVRPGNKQAREGRNRKKVDCCKLGHCGREKLGEVSWCHMILTIAAHVEVSEFILCFFGSASLKVLNRSSHTQVT